MHSRLLLLGEEIALTPATLLFKNSSGSKKPSYAEAAAANRCADDDPVVSSLTFDFIDNECNGSARGCAASNASAMSDSISLPCLSDLVVRRAAAGGGRSAGAVDAPGCDVLVSVMEKLWSGHQNPDLL